MKKTLLIIVFGLLAGYTAFAQKSNKPVTVTNDDIKIIEVDFTKMQNTSLAARKNKSNTSKTETLIFIDSINVGDYYQVVVNGINLNLYNVSLVTKDTILSTPQYTPTFADVSLDELNKALAGISSGNIQFSLTDLNKLLTSNILNDGLSKNLTGRQQEVDTLMMNAKDSLDLQTQRVKDIVRSIDDFKMQIYTIRLNSVRETMDSSSYNFKQALIDIQNIRKKINQEKLKAFKNFDEYKSSPINDKIVIESNKDLTAKDKAIRDSYDELGKSLDKITETISADKAYELLSSIVYLEDNISRNFVSLPQQFLGERGEVKLSITPRNTEVPKVNYMTSIVFPAKITRYTNIGVSFYGSTLHDET